MNNLSNPNIFEVIDGKVNLTKLAQSQNKEVREWLRNKSTTSYIKALEEARGNCPQLEVINGVGTFGTKELALKLAQWVSPKFEVYCTAKLNELFSTGKTQLESMSTLEMLKLAVSELETKEQQNKKLMSENILLTSRDLEVKTQKDYKWKSQMVQNDRGRTINYYVSQHFFNGDYAEAHRQAKKAYREATGIELPNKADYMSVDQKKDYLLWLSKI